MQIWLQRNNKYSFDREQPGLILNFLVALYKGSRGYMSPGEEADWAIIPLLGLQNELRPIPEPRFAHRENYYREGPNNQKFNMKLTLQKK
jgi:hypothetical protein